MKRYKQWLTAGLALGTVGALAGCATGNSSTSVTNNSVSANSVSNVSNVVGTSAPTLSSQVYVTADKYSTKSQNVTYPQLHGLPDAGVKSRLNAILKKNAIYVPTKTYSDPSSYSYTSSYNVVFKQGNIMNIVYSSYFVPTGANHGMPEHTSLILNLKTGATYSINEMFQPKSDYLQEISQEVQKQDTSHVLDSFQKFTGVTDKDTMFLREGGFVVDFGPEEWASYAQGFLDYYVPFSSVKNVIDATGPMWASLNDSTGFSATNYRDAEATKISSLGYTESLHPEYETTVTTSEGSVLTAWVGNNTKTDPTATGTLVFFFLNGKYLGTDTSKVHGAVKDVYPDGAGTIAVTYYNYSSTGVANPFTIHYHWGGSQLVAMGTFPDRFGTSTS